MEIKNGLENSPEIEPQTELPVAIVPGTGFKEDEHGKLIRPLQLSLEGKMRVLAAGMLFESKSVGKVIFSGGKAAGEDYESEAQVMRGYLFKKFPDIPEENIILEQESLSTDENAQNVKDVLDKLNSPTAFLLTSESHLDRASRIFGKAGVDYEEAISVESILKDRSLHYEAFLKRYLNSPRAKIRKAKELALTGLFYLDKEGKLTKFLVSKRQAREKRK